MRMEERRISKVWGKGIERFQGEKWLEERVVDERASKKKNKKNNNKPLEMSNALMLVPSSPQ